MPYKDKKSAASRASQKRAREKRYANKAQRKIDQLATANWKRNNPDAAELIRRKAYLKRYYGISIEQYNELIQKYNNTCWICRKPQDQFLKNLSVDHDHQTGEIRGLLCYSCNRNLVGHHRDAEMFLKAYEYLKGPYTGFIVPEQYLKGYGKKRKRKKS